MLRYFDIALFDVVLLNAEFSTLSYCTSCSCTLVALAIYVVSLFNITCIVLMLHYFNFALVFGALFNVVLFTILLVNAALF